MIKKEICIVKFISIFMLFLFLIMNTLDVFAISNNENHNQLKIVIEGLENNKENIDLTVHIYQIKKLVNLEEMKFEPSEKFENITEIDKKWDENSEEYVNSIKEYIEKNKIDGENYNLKYINEMTFNNFELGKYLIIIDDFILNDKKYECNSFIVNIPTEQSNGYKNFILTANPKISEIIEKNENVNPGNNEINNIIDKKILPDTGMPVLSIIEISICGLIFIIIGCILDKDIKFKKLDVS